MLKEDGLSSGFAFRHTLCSFNSSLDLSVCWLRFFFFASEPRPTFLIIVQYSCVEMRIRFDQHSEPLRFWPLFNYTFPLCKCRALLKNGSTEDHFLISPHSFPFFSLSRLLLLHWITGIIFLCFSGLWTFFFRWVWWWSEIFFLDFGRFLHLKL